jgi:uncharacterized protein (DUF58 family)
MSADATPADHARWEKTLRLVSRRHDVVGISIADQAELEMPSIGMVLIEDPESGELSYVDTSNENVRSLFGAVLTRERMETRRLFRRLGVDEIEVRTDEAYVRPLLAFFRRRERSRLR